MGEAVVPVTAVKGKTFPAVRTRIELGQKAQLTESVTPAVSICRCRGVLRENLRPVLNPPAAPRAGCREAIR